MLQHLFTSKVRVQILMRLFLNASSRAYLRELAKEFDVSPGHLRSELQQLSAAGLLSTDREGRQVWYSAEQAHPLFPELQSMVRKSLGMDRIIDSVVERLGNLEAAYLVGDYAEGRDTGIIDLVLIGGIDHTILDDLAGKVEKHIQRRIRTLVMTRQEFGDMTESGRLFPNLSIWNSQERLADE